MPWFVYYREDSHYQGLAEFNDPNDAAVYIAERMQRMYGKVSADLLSHYRVIHGTEQTLSKEGEVTIRFKNKEE